MSDIPQFTLNAENLDYATDEALQKDVFKTGGKYFDTPGTYDVVVSAADYHKNKETGSIYCKGDNTWFNVKLTFNTEEGKEIDYWIQVPTTSITFGQKQTLALFRKLQEFFFGLGETVTLNALQRLMQKHFAKPESLVGQKMSVIIGYEGPYVTADDTGSFVVIVAGKAVQEDNSDVRLPDRQSAIQYAKSKGINPSFMRVLKFLPKKALKLQKTGTDSW